MVYENLGAPCRPSRRRQGAFFYRRARLPRRPNGGLAFPLGGRCHAVTEEGCSPSCHPDRAKRVEGSCIGRKSREEHGKKRLSSDTLPRKISPLGQFAAAPSLGRNDRGDRPAEKQKAAVTKWRRGCRNGAGKPRQDRPECFSGKFFDSSGDTACKKIKKS